MKALFHGSRMAARAAALIALAAIFSAAVGPAASADPAPPAKREPSVAAPKRVVFLAGTKSHGPGDHEYEKGLRLLARSLERSPNAPPIQSTVVTDGWPQDETIFNDADAIVLYCDGSDHDERADPILRGDRLKTLDKLMARGVGMVMFHYAVFAPKDKAGDRFLDWTGGYFDYETGDAPNHWFSKIAVHSLRVDPASPAHPISRGVEPFDLTEEFYYNIRFRPADPRFAPILNAPIPTEPAPQTVAWAVQRADGGRGFGFTGGHFHKNWGLENFRRMALNAIVWAAGAEVPEGGVISTPPSPEDLAPMGHEADVAKSRGAEAPIRTLILTGYNGPFHDWRATTAALREEFARDPRFEVSVSEDPRFLASPDLMNYDLLVQNYVNWDRPTLGADARAGLLAFLAAGRGLELIHFAGGAWRDWPEYYGGLARRIWVDGKSSHDPYGPFRVRPTDAKHPILAGFAGGAVAGFEPFDTTDELYFDQQGAEPIEPLVVATSKVAGRDAPLAFAYEIRGGRVFQTLLGHDAASIRAPGAADLIRRGAGWAARREVVGLRDPEPAPAADAGPVTEGSAKVGSAKAGAADAGLPRGGGALDPRKLQVQAEPNPAYARAPITVEVRAKLDSKSGFNILVAHSPKSSSRHWELYSYAGSGALSAYFPGAVPAETVSATDICDGRWHDLAMTWEPGLVSLYVDGRRVARNAITERMGAEPAGPLFIGGIPTSGMGCDGLIDEVRVSTTIREIKPKRPDEEFDADDTLNLWTFDRRISGYEDFGQADNSAAEPAPGANDEWARKFGSPAPPPPAPAAGPTSSDPAKLDYACPDPRLSVRLLARSADESYLAVRPDSEGQVFVGGREALFVFEPTPKDGAGGGAGGAGGVGPARELYRFPPDTWITDIEFRGDDLYVMTAPALYLFKNGRVKREGLQPERLVWGIPVDLHVSNDGLAFGPEGDLYFTAGDPLLNYGDSANRPDHWGHWTIFHGPNKTDYTGQGGVFRISPDGARFETIARGLRGPNGLCFDRRWNLFTNDNDHESLPHMFTPGKLLHVTRGVDFGWPRGWTAARSPERSDLLPLVYEGLGRAVPVGQAIYDETLLPEEYRDNILLARWCRMEITRYPLARAGSSWRAEKEEVLLRGSGTARPVGVAVGSDGRVFATIAYMGQNEGSPHYASDLIVISRADAPGGLPDYKPYSPTKASEAMLSGESMAPDWARSRTAHLEILRRRSDMLGAPAQQKVEADAELDSLSRGLVNTTYPPPENYVGELMFSSSRDPLFLDTLARLADAKPEPIAADLARAIMAGPAVSVDERVRQIAAWALSRRAPLEILAAGLKAPDAPAQTRLAAALALGMRLTLPDPDAPPPANMKIAYESPNAVFDIPYAGGKVDIRKLGVVGSYTIAELWASKPRPEKMTETANALLPALNDPDARVAAQAAFYLNLLGEPRFAPAIAAARERDVARRLADAPARPVDRAWVAGPLPDGSGGFATVHPPETGAISLDRPIPSGEGAVKWELVKSEDGGYITPAFSDADSDSASASTYIFTRLQSGTAQTAELRVAFGTGFAAWLNGAPVARNEGVRGAGPTVDAVRLDLSPGSSDLLVRVRAFGPPASATLSIKALGPLSVEPPETAGGLAGLADRLRAADIDKGEEPIPAEFLGVDWPAEIARADVKRGRDLFGADGLGCAKCHSLSADQAGAGAPSLAEAGRRFTLDHIIESVLRPSARIAEVFHATLLQTADDTITGLVTGETADKIDMLLPDGTRKSLPKSEIKERRPLTLSPMPQTLVRTPDELRDIAAFLLGQ